MENLSEISGYVASTLVLLTFVAKDMRLLRTIAHLRHDRVAAGRPFSAHGAATEHRSTCGDRQGSSSHGRPHPSRGCCPRPNFVHRHDSSRPIASSALADFPQNARRQRAQPNQSDQPSHREIRESPLFPGWLTGRMGRRCTGL